VAILGEELYGIGKRNELMLRTQLNYIFSSIDELCFQYGDYRRAYDLFSVLKNDSSYTILDSKIYARLGNLNRFWRKWEVAQIQLKISLEINENNWFAKWVQLRCLADRGLLDQAIAQYQELHFPISNDIRVLQQKMALEISLNKLLKAKKTEKAALAINPNDAGTLYTSGLLANKLGNPKKAITTLTRSLYFRAQHAPALVARSQAYLQLGEIVKAEQDLLQAFQLVDNCDQLFNYQDLFNKIVTTYPALHESLASYFSLKKKDLTC
jgi:tetratricopeptide (TPR) repeat protein